MRSNFLLSITNNRFRIITRLTYFTKKTSYDRIFCNKTIYCISKRQQRVVGDQLLQQTDQIYLQDKQK